MYFIVGLGRHIAAARLLVFVCGEALRWTRSHRLFCGQFEVRDQQRVRKRETSG